MRLLLVSMSALLLGGAPTPAAPAKPEISITTRDGSAVVLGPEETEGLFARPLIKTRDRLKKKFGRDFLFLHKIHVAEGERIEGKITLDEGPLRLTIYEITKNPQTPRSLRVIGSKYYLKGETALFQTELKPWAEHAFLITAEAVTSKDQLNAHLKYMNTQGDEILVQGFGTNWNLTTLKFKMSEKKPGKDAEFAKDADWMVGNLIDPRWVVSIRLE